MLVIGPGYGHNAEGKSTSLNDNDCFYVTFAAFSLDSKFVQKFNRINYVKINELEVGGRLKLILNVFWITYQLIRLCRKVSFDVIYVLGLNGYIVVPLFKWIRGRSIIAYELWSNAVLDSIEKGNGLTRYVNSLIFKHVDYVCQYWWGIREKFISIFPQYESKYIMYQLSYPDIYFAHNECIPECDFVKGFLKSIPENQKVCFWPRSFNASNNHVLFLQALDIINKNTPTLLENFKLYLWGGNVESADSRLKIETAIKEYSLAKYVQIVDHPFVPQNDIFAIEQRSDFFVQISNDDILSTYIMEIICSEKPFLLSNLRTYQFLNEVYQLNIDLVENDATIIAKRFSEILEDGNNWDKEMAPKRKNICIKRFSRRHTLRWYQILYNKLYVK